jgi:hypothetical protein
VTGGVKLTVIGEFVLFAVGFCICVIYVAYGIGRLAAYINKRIKIRAINRRFNEVYLIIKSEIPRR